MIGAKTTITHSSFIIQEEPCPLHADLMSVSLPLVNSRFQLLQSTNHLPSNSKPPQIKMQSTKKTLPYKEEGSTPANEEPSSTARPASPSSLQHLVRLSACGLKEGWEEGVIASG